MAINYTSSGLQYFMIFFHWLEDFINQTQLLLVTFHHMRSLILPYLSAVAQNSAMNTAELPQSI